MSEERKLVLGNVIGVAVTFYNDKTVSMDSNKVSVKYMVIQSSFYYHAISTHTSAIKSLRGMSVGRQALTKSREPLEISKGILYYKEGCVFDG